MIRLGASASASGRLQSFPCTTRPSSVIQYFAYPTSTSIRYLSSKLKRHPNIRSRVNDSACQELNKNRKIGWKKKKVAVVFGYVGKGYSGLQMIDPAVRTIEREVEEALFQLGCILPTNKQNLDKIGWSRSSRTDKGVHAARIVVSAKLLLAPEWLHDPQEEGSVEHENETDMGAERVQRVPALVEQLNQLLPPAVRAFSCTRVNQGFQAREACHWREYEYLIPTRLVLAASPSSRPGTATSSANDPFRWKEPVKTEQEFVNRLNEVFCLMEGSKSMHNYHRKKDSKYEIEQKQEQLKNANVDKASHHPVIGKDIMWGDDSTPNLGYDEHKQEGEEEGYDMDRFQYEHWHPEIVRELTNGSLYMVRAFPSSSLGGTRGGAPEEMGMVTIRLRGQGFLMNQIRLMVSAAVLYARGIIPLELVHLSLDTPYRCMFPLAPAEGLLLVDSGYSRNVSGQNYTLHPYHEEQKKDLGTLALMSAEEFNVSEEFKHTTIYPEIQHDWGSNECDELVMKWFHHCDEYLISPKLHTKMNALLDDYKLFIAPQLQIKYGIYTRRVATAIEKYNVAVIDIKKRLAEARRVTSEIESLRNDRPNDPILEKDLKKREYAVTLHVKAGQVELPHKLFLPNGTSAALITKFNVLPSGDVISRVLRALAYAVAEQEVAVFDDASDVVQHISNTEGGIWTWAEKKRVSPVIT